MLFVIAVPGRPAVTSTLQAANLSRKSGATVTKSYKEAQTWLSVVLLAPALPILVVSILMIRSSTALMFIPSLSQHLLLVSLIKNEPMNMLHVAISSIGTLTIGVLVSLLCARLYRREGRLG